MILAFENLIKKDKCFDNMCTSYEISLLITKEKYSYFLVEELIKESLLIVSSY